jgi:hypothetical protein
LLGSKNYLQTCKRHFFSFVLAISLQTFSGKGKTLVVKWERLDRLEGDYIFEKGENVETYLKAVGRTDLGSILRNSIFG